jgi:Glyoxalase-like domain
MATRLDSVVVDAEDPPTLARWWAQALDWRVTLDESDEAVAEPAPAEPGVALVFVRVDDPRRIKNRLHLDLRTVDRVHQQNLVDRLLSSGAAPVDVGQPTSGPHAVPWVVLADPEGNEFCVLDPRPVYGPDAGAVAAIVVDAAAPERLAQFWRLASGWLPAAPTGDGVTSLRAPDGRGPFLEFLEDSTERVVKNRLHLDVAPHLGDDQEGEVARLVAVGARPAEVGQSAAERGDVTWVVLTDPEGNEFCVLSPR